eukprot:scaffold31536_cov140-Isochrysis_galbana.AAC.2
MKFLISSFTCKNYVLSYQKIYYCRNDTVPRIFTTRRRRSPPAAAAAGRMAKLDLKMRHLSSVCPQFSIKTENELSTTYYVVKRLFGHHNGQSHWGKLDPVRGKAIDMCRSILFTMATPHDLTFIIHTAPGPTVPPSDPAGSPAVAGRFLLLAT